MEADSFLLEFKSIDVYEEMQKSALEERIGLSKTNQLKTKEKTFTSE